MSKVQSYGSWGSSVTVELLASQPPEMTDLCLTSTGVVYWVESRPHEGGRHVIMRLDKEPSQPQEVTPQGFDVRTRVHEYGGAPYVVVGDTIYFSHYADHRLYRQRLGSSPEAITPEAKLRYADLTWDAERGRILAVREDHRTSDIAARTTIVSIDPDVSDGGRVLAEGWDFFMYPRLNPDGTRLAWMCWNHPLMPWDESELWVANLDPAGAVVDLEKVSGKTLESIFQPEWSPDGTLYFVSDQSGWWNLYRWRAGLKEAVYPKAAEFGQPHWQFGQSTYGFSGGKIIARYTQDDRDYLVAIDPDSLRVKDIPTPYAVISHVVANHDRVVFFAASFDRAVEIVALNPQDDTLTTRQSGGELPISQDDISRPMAMVFPTEDHMTAHLWYYPPTNQAFLGPEREKPPLVVFNHGGPTSNSRGRFRLDIQYWTSRGFAVADVNYRGSTGYGTSYRRLLNQSWGIVDVQDCCNAARYLVGQGLADEKRLAIRGGSAGGYTTLACLTFKEVFQVGASYFGVSDVSALALETHKFESHYMDSLVGPWPDAKARYDARSPLKHVAEVHRPIIFFQGLDDKVVLPNQAEKMVDEMKARGVPVAYLAFPGEGHGFQRADTIKRTLTAELYFYREVFGIPHDDDVQGVEIFNWPDPV